MSNINENDDIKLILDDYQEIEDYTVFDVSDMVDEEEEERRRRRRQRMKEKNNKKKKKKRRLKVVLLVLEIFIVLILGLVAFVLLAPDNVRNKMLSCGGKCAGTVTGLEKKFDEKFNDSSFDKDKVNVNEELDTSQYEDYTTIALFGIDSRENSLDVGLSDSIIIATIDNKTSEVKMSSIYRDTYVSIIDEDGDTQLNRINTAFSKGGVELALTNLNRNMDLSIDEYAVVNFAGLATIIDALFGEEGVKVNITSDERYWINQYLIETRKVTGLSSPNVSKSGEVYLNGLQATAFCRIRYTSFTDEDGTKYNNDMGRTARQRFIIRKMLEKAQQMDLNTLIDIANELFGKNEPAFKTSLSYKEIMDMLPTVLKVRLGGNQGFPITLEVPPKEQIPGEKSVVVASGLTYNVTKLHEFLYPKEDYTPTTTLKNISNDIMFQTSVPEKKLPEDE